MSAATLSGGSLAAVQQQFVAALPSMNRVLAYHARTWPPRNRDDMIADAHAALWAAWCSLTRRGKDPLQVGVTGIVGRCCRYVRSGRKIGNQNRGRGCLDVLDHRARRRLGIDVVSLERDEETVAGNGWRDWLVGNRGVTPADEAAFRVDFDRWLSGLPERKRRMAKLLLDGNQTSIVATRLAVTPAAVSITRTWLERSWKAFQGESAPAKEAAKRPVGRPRKGDQQVQRGSGQEALVPLVAAGT